MKGKMIFFSISILSSALTILAPGLLAAADPFPSRPIQVIVPFPPGGVADLVARPFSAALEPVLNQPVAVVNKSGAGGAVGMQAAAVAKPDGYTLMVALSSISHMPIVDEIFGRPPTYNRQDFIPICLLTADPCIFVVKNEKPWKTVADFVADAKQRPNEIKYSSSGVYGVLHIAMVLFTHPAGIQLRHIPTAGGGPALNATLGGHVDCQMTGPNVVYPHIKAGTLRVLAVEGDKRLPPIPHALTFKELGYDIEYYVWAGFFAPKSTPLEIVQVLRDSARKAAHSDMFKNALEKMNTPLAYLDGPEFQKFWDKDAKRIEQAIRHIGKIQ
jgi:tripartite-type tricarboxylate transporter receptor subunit TctC